MQTQLKLKKLVERFAICKLAADSPFPDWLRTDGLMFLARTPDELSIICPQKDIPTEQPADQDWCCLRIDGDLAFDEIGVVARVSTPPANVGLSVFVISTHDRDYVLVAEQDLEALLRAYRESGFFDLNSLE